MNKSRNFKIVIIALLSVIAITVTATLYSRIQIVNVLNQDNDNHKLGIVIESEKVVLPEEYEKDMTHLWNNLDKSNPKNLKVIVNYINDNVYNSPYLIYQNETYKPIIEVNHDGFEISMKSLETDNVEHLLNVEVEEDIVSYSKLVLTPLVHFIMKAQMNLGQENSEQLMKKIDLKL